MKNVDLMLSQPGLEEFKEQKEQVMALAEAAGAADESGAEIARRLGIDRVTWWRVRVGDILLSDRKMQQIRARVAHRALYQCLKAGVKVAEKECRRAERDFASACSGGGGDTLALASTLRTLRRRADTGREVLGAMRRDPGILGAE